MKAAVFVEPGRIVLEDKPVPKVGPGDALIKVQIFEPGDDWRQNLFNHLLGNEYVYQSDRSPSALACSRQAIRLINACLWFERHASPKTSPGLGMMAWFCVANSLTLGCFGAGWLTGWLAAIQPKIRRARDAPFIQFYRSSNRPDTIGFLEINMGKASTSAWRSGRLRSCLSDSRL